MTDFRAFGFLVWTVYKLSIGRSQKLVRRPLVIIRHKALKAISVTLLLLFLFFFKVSSISSLAFTCGAASVTYRWQPHSCFVALLSALMSKCSLGFKKSKGYWNRNEMSPCTPDTSARRNVAEIRQLLADFRSGFVFLCGSTGVEVMCFDGGGWLGPAGEQRGAPS